MSNTEKPTATFDLPAAAEQFVQVRLAAEDALSHMDTSLTLAEAQLAVVRHHQTHRLAQHATAD